MAGKNYNSSVSVVIGDGYKGEAGVYDAALVDAPCTATGTGRRNPDVMMFGCGEGRKKRDAKVLEECVETQRRLFREAANAVKSGGCVVFATCSMLKEEGEEQVRWILEEWGAGKGKGGGGGEAEVEVWGIEEQEVPGFEGCVREGGWVRVWPGEHGDGFFVCRFKVL